MNKKTKLQKTYIMKTKIFKACMILGGSMLLGAYPMNAGTNYQSGNFVNEHQDFHLQGFQLIIGIIVCSLLIYFFSNRSDKEKQLQDKLNYSRPRRHHHRAIIKKTS